MNESRSGFNASAGMLSGPNAFPFQLLNSRLGLLSLGFSVLIGWCACAEVSLKTHKSGIELKKSTAL